jgi:hypothetical protein
LTTTQTIAKPPAVLGFRVCVQGREAFNTRDGHEDVPPDESDQPAALLAVMGCRADR